MKIKEGEYVTSLPVDDYLEETGDYDDDKNAAFEACSFAEGDVVELATEELEGFGLKNFKVVGAEFIEFDSRNITHACGHFNCLVEGATTEQIEALFA